MVVHDDEVLKQLVHDRVELVVPSRIGEEVNLLKASKRFDVLAESIPNQGSRALINTEHLSKLVLNNKK